jgi:hypothetical protein
MPTKFDFVSPGIELREIDQSQVAPVPEADGLLLIGRSRKGPAMKPVKVTSLENFIEVFGAPMDGVKASDPWRQGNTSAASYAGYAAQAYLASGVGPVKFIRLGGLGGGTGKEAGWSIGQEPVSPGIAAADHKGALGLFVAPSSSLNEITGTLAAIFYSNENQITLKGTGWDGTADVNAASTFVQGPGGEFEAEISNSAGSSSYTFNFNKNSVNFIRNVFNTDPTSFDDSSPSYFLGETFEAQVNDFEGNNLIAFVAQIGDTSEDWTAFESELRASRTGWFVGVTPANKKLFKIVALDDGAQFQSEYYVVVKDLSEASVSKKEATFTIEVRKYGQAGYVEKFSNITLNPDSPNFITKKIGDFHQYWQEGTDGKTGKFVVDVKKMNPNQSNLIRIELAENSTLAGSDLPVGFVGPQKRADIDFVHDESSVDNVEWMYGSSSVPGGNTDSLVSGSKTGINYKFTHATHLLTDTGSYLGTRDYPAGAVFGLRWKETNGTDQTIGDVGILRSDTTFDMDLVESDDVSNASYFFSLEKMQVSSGAYYHQEDATSSNIVSGTISDILKAGVKQFAAPFFGGFDGVNQLLKNPFNETRINTDNYERHSVFQTLEMIQDRDIIRYDLVSIPGVTNQRIVGDLLRQTEDRGDALAIVDLEGIYQSNADNGNSDDLDTDLDLDSVITTMNTMALNTSYGATYYPNIRLRDTLNGNGTVLMAPPSVAAIGAIAKSEGDSQPWFAPAGFNRGGLNPLGGNKGPVVLGSAEHLTKSDRDKLYEVNINPIARFPATGDTVVFGQKTLQQDASALDRINVRRLMNYLKREIGDIADTILFDQNVQATWNRFKTRAEAVLSQVRSDYGITEYKLVLDETTTTPDLQDRNILYAKVFVKPARAIEFIAVDFVITQSGVEF